MRAEGLSRAQARRVAITAQGLAAGRPTDPGMRQLTGVVDRIGLLQIDSVNVLVRAHFLPLFSRLGSYDPELLDRASGQGPEAARGVLGSRGVAGAAGDPPAAALADGPMA